MDDHERQRNELKARIGTLQILYGVFFVGSLVLLGLNWSVFGHTTLGTVAWGLTLAAAVATRIYRTSLVNKFNALAFGVDAPLS